MEQLMKRVNLMRLFGLIIATLSITTVLGGCNPNKSSDTTTGGSTSTTQQGTGGTTSSNQQPGTAPSPGSNVQSMPGESSSTGMESSSN
jgi:hypothetical protein